MRIVDAVNAEIDFGNAAVLAPLLECLEQPHAVATHALFRQDVVMHDAGGELLAKDVLFQHCEQPAHYLPLAVLSHETHVPCVALCQSGSEALRHAGFVIVQFAKTRDGVHVLAQLHQCGYV